MPFKSLKYFRLVLLPNLTDLCNYAQMLQIVRGIYHGFFLLSISEKAIQILQSRKEDKFGADL